MTQSRASLALLAVIALVGVARADIVAPFGPFGVRLTLTDPTQPDPAGHPGVYETTISLSSTYATPNIVSFDLWANGTVNGATGAVVQEGKKASSAATKFSVVNYASTFPSTSVDPDYNPALDSYWIPDTTWTYANPGTGYLGPDGWNAGTDLFLNSSGIKGAVETYPAGNLSESVRLQSLTDYRYAMAFGRQDASTIYPIQDWGPVLHLAFTGPSVNLWLNTLTWANGPVTTANGNYLLVVPEPVTLALLAVGAAGLLRRRRPTYRRREPK